MDRRSATASILAAPLAGLALPANATSVGKLERALREALAGRATGAFLVAKEGRVLCRGGVGMAEKNLSAPSADTAFDALSIGKTFTAIALLRLAEIGRVDLDARIRSYFPELGEAFADIRVRHTLNNDAGLPTYLEGGDLDLRSAAEALAEISRIVRERKAGSGSAYSNVSYHLLGLLVERVSGRPLPELVAQLVIAPAGLKQTGFFGQGRLAGVPHVDGHVDGRRVGVTADWPQTWSLLGAAGLFSSVDDLYRLNRTFLAGRGLGPGMRARFLSGGAPTYGRGPYRSPDTIDISYGAGLYHWLDRAGRHIAFHGGDGEFGFNAAMFWRAEDDVFVAVMTNSRWAASPLDRGVLMTAILSQLEP